MMWAAVTVSFYGLLRASEFLAPAAQRVDSNRTLLWRAITLQPSSVSLQLGRIKTQQLGSGGIVQLLSTSDGHCPVVAMHRFAQASAQLGTDAPVFKFHSGKLLTRDELTCFLRVALKTSSVSSHSMRIGGATYMASKGANEW